MLINEQNNVSVQYIYVGIWGENDSSLSTKHITYMSKQCNSYFMHHVLKRQLLKINIIYLPGEWNYRTWYNNEK